MTKSAQILCNATGNIPRLTIIADVMLNPDSVDLFQVHPLVVDLDKDHPQDQKKPWEYDFKIKNISPSDLSFTVVSRPDKYVQIDFPADKTITPGAEKTFAVKINPKMADDLFNKTITIEASDAKHTRYSIPISKTRRWGPVPTSER